jgi:hypothetical protein
MAHQRQRLLYGSFRSSTKVLTLEYYCLAFIQHAVWTTRDAVTGTVRLSYSCTRWQGHLLSVKYYTSSNQTVSTKSWCTTRALGWAGTGRSTRLLFWIWQNYDKMNKPENHGLFLTSQCTVDRYRTLLHMYCLILLNNSRHRLSSATYK